MRPPHGAQVWRQSLVTWWQGSAGQQLPAEAVMTGHAHHPCRPLQQHVACALDEQQGHLRPPDPASQGRFCCQPSLCCVTQAWHHQPRHVQHRPDDGLASPSYLRPCCRAGPYPPYRPQYCACGHHPSAHHASPDPAMMRRDEGHFSSSLMPPVTAHHPGPCHHHHCHEVCHQDVSYQPYGSTAVCRPYPAHHGPSPPHHPLPHHPALSSHDHVRLCPYCAGRAVAGEVGSP